MMSRYQVLQSFRTKILLIPALVLAATTAVTAQDAGITGEENSRLATYETVAGETNFALSLVPNIELPAAPADVVIMFDTSASQTGLYRKDGMTALSQILQHLNADDRVAVATVDVQTKSLTEGLVASDDASLDKVIEKIEHRLPLGATDLPLVLKNASAIFDGDDSRARHLIYIGDGMSTANIVDPQEYQAMIGNLVENQISFSSFAIGPDRDIVFLAALANQSGGNLAIDSDQIGSASVAGTTLANTVHAAVVWPESVKLSEAIEVSYPSQLPPLRTDRDTILIGKMKSAKSIETTVTGTSCGKPVSLSWNTTVDASNPDFSFLPQLVSRAAKDDGISMPILGSSGLRESGRVILASANSLLKLSGQAAARGAIDDAKRLADAALETDPENNNAKSMQKLILKRQEDDTKMMLVIQNDDEPIEEVKIPDGVNLSPKKIDDEILRKQMQERARQASRLTSEVEDTLAETRDLLNEAPSLAISRLKVALEEVKLAPDLDAKVRSQLRNRLVAAIKTAGRKAVEVEAEIRVRAETEAKLQEQREVIETTLRREEEIKQLVQQFNALVDDGEGMQAINDIVPRLQELDPRSVIPRAASEYAQFYDNWDRMQDLRDQRWRGVWLTLYQVELSSIPTPDEPPIVYPDPEFWERITQQRAKYKAVDLVNPDGAEAQIASSLNDTTSLDFFEQPLTDVVEFLKDQHRINAQLDIAGLDLAGVSPEDQVTKSLSGISLRSALRLLLKDLDLTYIIKDEVLQITSNEAANENLVTKVYNVGDLVVPIPISGGGGLGVAGGGGGGLNGGGGGGGGGFGGGGGGGFGGGGGGLGGGGGGGLFVIQDSLKLGKKSTTNVSQPSSNAVTADSEGSREQTVFENRPGTLLPVKVNKEDDATQAWEDYFSQNTAHPADVRFHSRHLMRLSRFDHALAMLSAAMRHDQIQPWMYQGLAVAMQAAQAPREDVERALLSALDGNTSVEDKMRVAAYMDKINLNERAFQLFRDVAIANPTLPLPYAEALRVAQEMEDDDRIVWACSGLLNQPWTDSQHPVRRKAANTLRAKYIDAKRQGLTELAARIEKEYGDAIVNDCVIKVTWTGEADVDLVVEEPSGSVCSMRNPRTESGGVLMEGSWSMVGNSDGQGFTETYVCPKGFSGDYRVLVKKIWGDTTAGKVIVEVIRNEGDDSETRERQTIDLDDNGNAMVLFKLDSGRRTEALEEHQIAAVADRQQKVNRSLLGQLLDQYDSSAAAAAYNRSRGLPSPAEVARLKRSRGAGYRPVITTLPEGAFMTATAVVSADRRYVRVSPTPQFTQVISVSTFNFVTGAGGTGGVGGGGGQGVPGL